MVMAGAVEMVVALPLAGGVAKAPSMPLAMAVGVEVYFVMTLAGEMEMAGEMVVAGEMAVEKALARALATITIKQHKTKEL